jgi:transcriptional regulator GlxA family with amidase domain
MHVAIPLYPRFTALDAVGPYTVLAFAPGWRVTFIATEPGPVVDDRGGLSLVATNTYSEIPHPDVVLVPGGPGTEPALADTALLEWLATAHERSTWTASVCSGSLILGAAGILKDRPATCHWGWRNLLTLFGAIPVDERIVFSDKVVTAAGVSAGIDMALAFLGRAADEATARAVQLAIEYDPQPPYDSGAADRADDVLKQSALALIS